jgi:hypothetical protein
MLGPVRPLRDLAGGVFADLLATGLLAGLRRTRPGRAGLRRAGPGCAGLELAGSGLAGLGLAGSGLAGSGLAGLGLAVLGRAGPGGTGLRLARPGLRLAGPAWARGPGAGQRHLPASDLRLLRGPARSLTGCGRGLGSGRLHSGGMHDVGLRRLGAAGLRRSR